MAGKQIDPKDLKAAIAAYCAANGKQFSEGDGGKFTIFAGTPQPGDAMLWLENGALRGNDIDFCLNFAEGYLMPANGGSQEKKANLSIAKSNGSNVNMARPLSQMTVQDIKDHFCHLATDQEAYTFLQTCLMAGANPWLSEAYLIKYDEKATAKTVMGKYYFLKKAEKHPQYGGFSSGIIVKNLEGKIEERIGKFKLPEETLLGGWSEVTRLDRKVPMKVTVSLSEYDKGNSQWRKMGPTMIEKVAIVQSHRDMFPGDLGGIYDGAEIIDAECEVAE